MCSPSLAPDHYPGTWNFSPHAWLRPSARPLPPEGHRQHTARAGHLSSNTKGNLPCSTRRSRLTRSTESKAVRPRQLKSYCRTKCYHPRGTIQKQTQQLRISHAIFNTKCLFCLCGFVCSGPCQWRCSFQESDAGCQECT